MARVSSRATTKGFHCKDFIQYQTIRNTIKTQQQ